MRLVLFGDIHAHRLWVGPWRLSGKRLAGQMNLWLRRRRHFDLGLLPPALHRASALHPDVVLLSGDLTATALEAEFADVAAMLSRVPACRPDVLVPGNHDRYTFSAARRRVVERAFAGAVPARFPHTRRLNDSWQLLALDASVPRVLSSRGRLGSAQLREADAFVRTLSAGQGLVVLCHYPFGAPESVKMPWGHRLEDAAALIDVLAASRADVLFLHGHVHRPWRWCPSDPRLSRVVDVNAGSPTLRGRTGGRGHGFWQIDLPEHSAKGVVLIRHEPAPDGEGDWTQHDVR